MSNANILVTGGTGRLGSVVCQHLGKKNINFHNLEKGENCRGGHWTCFVHLATNYGEGTSRNDVYEANYFFPKRILEKLSEAPLRRVINIDTILPQETNLYSKTKCMFREYLAGFSDRYQVVNLRPHIIYGPPMDSVVDKIVHAAAKNQQMDLSYGFQIRDFVYIEDLVAIIMHFATEVSNFEPGLEDIEIGEGKGYSIRQLVSLAQEHFVRNSARFNFGTYQGRPSDPKTLVSRVPLTELFKQLRIRREPHCLSRNIGNLAMSWLP